MKHTFLLLFIVLFFANCKDNAKNLEHPIKKEGEIDTAKNDLWGVIQIKSWAQTPAINGRVATIEDVNNGLAVYSSENDQAKPYDILLPKLAYLNDLDTNKKEIVVVIQVEITSKGEIAGYRNLNGGNGICLLSELKFLNEEQIKQVTAN